MKRLSFNIMQTALLLCVFISSSCQKGKPTTPEIGTLTVFHAKEKIEGEHLGCEKGQLYFDSNDSDVRFKSDDDNYVFEIDADSYDGARVESWSVPKSKLDKKTYKMYQLSAREIGSKAVFVSNNGCTASIFLSNINGHKFCSWDGKEVKWDYTNMYAECYVLSAEIINRWDGEKFIFEEPLDENQGFFKLYFKPFIGEDLQIGKLEDNWINKEGWSNNISAYSDDGKLLTDQWQCDGIPDEISIAYLAEENALYIDGNLYFRK